MTASIFYDSQDTRTLHPLTLRTGALAVLVGMPAHPALADSERPPADAVLRPGSLVTIYAQPTDINPGNLALLDDGSGPVDCYVDPTRLSAVIRAMRHREPVSIIAKYNEDHSLQCQELIDPPGGLISVADAGAIVERMVAKRIRDRELPRCDAHDVAGCIECSVPDPEDEMPGYREEVEWVTRRGGRARPEERARVQVSSDVDGECAVVERLIHVTLERDAFRTRTPAWVPVDDPAERAALMAEAALRLYARTRRHDQRATITAADLAAVSNAGPYADAIAERGRGEK